MADTIPLDKQRPLPQKHAEQMLKTGTSHGNFCYLDKAKLSEALSLSLAEKKQWDNNPEEFEAWIGVEKRLTSTGVTLYGYGLDRLRIAAGEMRSRQESWKKWGGDLPAIKQENEAGKNEKTTSTQPSKPAPVMLHLNSDHFKPSMAALIIKQGQKVGNYYYVTETELAQWLKESKSSIKPEAFIKAEVTKRLASTRGGAELLGIPLERIHRVQTGGHSLNPSKPQDEKQYEGTIGKEEQKIIE